jgi:ATP-dependent protease La (LON) substrate-binding domain
VIRLVELFFPLLLGIDGARGVAGRRIGQLEISPKSKRNRASILVERITLPGKDEEVPALFSKDIVLFPRMQVSMTLGEEDGIGAVGRALKQHHLVAFIPTDFESQKEGIGVLTQVLSSEQTPNGLRVGLRGLWRVRVTSPFGLGSVPLVRIEKADEIEGSAGDGLQAVRRVRKQIDEFRELIPDIPQEITAMLLSAQTASELSDLCAMSPTLTHEERLELLLTLNPDERLGKLNKHFDRELETLRTMVEGKPIPNCEICADLADRAFDSDPGARAEAIVEFLNHVVSNHTTELLNLLGEKYGPGFMRKRSLR